MSLAWLFPLGFAALAAWVLPLLLHLVRREQRTPTDFAALRWLAVRTRPRRRVRFDERWLLAVRLALIAAFALLLARPALVGGGEGGAWEVVHPAVPVATVAADDGIERRWLAEGFPPLDAPPPAAPTATASLLRQFDSELPPGATLAVRVPATLDGLDGERLRLSRPVRWIVGDDRARRAGATPASSPEPSSDLSPGASRAALAIRHDDAHAAGAGWLRAVAAAWQRRDDARPDIAPLAAPLPAASRGVAAWLSAGALPDTARGWADAGGTLLLPHDAPWPLPRPGSPLHDDAGEPVVEAAPLGAGRVVRLRRPLQPAAWPALLEPAFPRLLHALVASPPPAPARAAAGAVIPEDGGATHALPPREFPSAIAWFLVALVALERWLATGRRAGPAT